MICLKCVQQVFSKRLSLLGVVFYHHSYHYYYCCCFEALGAGNLPPPFCVVQRAGIRFRSFLEHLLHVGPGVTQTWFL